MGSVVVSIDAELGWGFHDLPNPPSHRLSAGRKGWSRLASLLDAYDVPATWAVVGHLFLDSCDGHHDDHPLGPAWFARERTAWADQPGLRFGVDMVRTLVESPVAHDIGCHTFSHVIADDPDVTPSVFRAELEACVTAFERLGVDPVSMVYPRNRIGHREILADFGYTSYRTAGPNVSPARRRLTKVRRLAATEAPLVEPWLDRFGLVAIPPSLFLFGFDGLVESLVEPVLGDPVVTQVERGIDRAITSDGVLHLWLHPNNLTDSAAVDRVRSILAYISGRQSAQGLRVETMREIADRVRQASPRPSTSD